MLDREVETFYAPEPRRRRIWRGKRGAAKPDRDAQMVVMREGGAKLEDIGVAFGVSRERVRQIMERNGLSELRWYASADPLRVLAAVRNPASMDSTDVARAVGASNQETNKVLGALGINVAAQRLFRWRRARAFVVKFQALAVRLGRTPTVIDISAAGMHQSGIQLRFGGMQALARRAGLAPTPTGRRRRA